MKRITVGRATDCDIVIPAEADSVSRQHLVVTLDFFGRLAISDKSSNGTFVNDKRLQKGVSMPVKRTDIVRLGDDTILDWNRIPDSYRNMRIMVYAFIGLALCCAIAAVVYYAVRPEEKNDPVIVINPGEESSSDEWNKDSTQKVAPVEESIHVNGVSGKKEKSTTPTVKKQKTVSPKKVKNDKIKRIDSSVEKEIKNKNSHEEEPAMRIREHSNKDKE